jgi:hypothetical protein
VGARVRVAATRRFAHMPAPEHQGRSPSSHQCPSVAVAVTEPGTAAQTPHAVARCSSVGGAPSSARILPPQLGQSQQPFRGPAAAGQRQLLHRRYEVTDQHSTALCAVRIFRTRALRRGPKRYASVAGGGMPVLTGPAWPLFHSSM